MKKVLFLAAFISMAAHADNLKIIDTKVEQISYAEYLSQVKHVGTKTAMCTASANAASGFAGQNTTASGYVSYVITNNTTVTQNYWADEYMCINGSACTHVRNTVTLGAHLTGSGGGQISTHAMLNKGTYTDQSTMQVTGESTCFVQGSNTVYIN